MNTLVNKKLAIELAKGLIQRNDVKVIVSNSGDIRFIIDEVEFDFADIAHEFFLKLERLEFL